MKTKKTMKRLLSGIKRPPNTIIARNSYYAQSRLAYLLKNGLGVTKNYPAGMAWTKRAAKNGNASGQISLAISYEYGIDNILRKDGNSALYWYKKLLSTKTLENSRSL